MSVLGLSILAGLLTCLSPCVFPVVPLIVGSSLQQNRFGPVVLSIGLIISFTTVGVILMATGAAAGLTESLLRPLASILLILAGAFLLSSYLQEKLSAFLTPFAAKADGKLQSANYQGLFGQFITGSMLGILWSPCTGPTMGATLALGAKDGPSLFVVLSMFLFGVGASLPILAIAYGARTFLTAKRGKIIETATFGKKIFGYLLIIVGLFTFFKWDKTLESTALDFLPEWITELSVRY